MNKKVNTALFMLGATIANLIMWAIIFLAGLKIISLLFPNFLGTETGVYIPIVYFFAATILTFLVYNRIMKYITSKFDFEKYFMPIFRKKK